MSLKSASITITPRQQELLTLLSQDEPCHVSRIASAFHISPAAATKAVDRLERKGLVTRAQNTRDRRRVDVHLTQSGTKSIGPSRAFPGNEGVGR
jgi:DNA-binding MarR family transcriptional regulator